MSDVRRLYCALKGGMPAVFDSLTGACLMLVPAASAGRGPHLVANGAPTVIILVEYSLLDAATGEHQRVYTVTCSQGGLFHEPVKSDQSGQTTTQTTAKPSSSVRWSCQFGPNGDPVSPWWAKAKDG